MTLPQRFPKILPTAFAALVLSFGSLTAQVGEPFSEARFEALQAEGALILVDVHADWCPTCRAQQEALSAFPEKHPGTELYILTVDFDEQKEWVRHFGAPGQSTLILFRGEERVWFSVGETREEEIFSQIVLAAAAER